MPRLSPVLLHACWQHATGATRTLATICSDQDYGYNIMDDYESDEEEDGSRGEQPRLLWGDFGVAQIIPHLTRHSPEAQVGS